MACGFTLDAARAIRAPASRVRGELGRALRDAGFKIARETTTTIEARRGSQLAASLSPDKLPLIAGVRLALRPDACEVHVHLEDAWRSPLNRVYGLNGKYDRLFRGVLEAIDAELARLDPGAAPAFPPPVSSAASGEVAVMEKANAAYGDAARAAAGAVDRKLGGGPAEGAPPASWKGVERVRLVTPEAILELGIEETQAVLGVAALVGAQPGKMPPALVRHVEQLAARIEEVLESGLPQPELQLATGDRDAVDFLRQQAAIREALPVRRLLLCRDCRFEKIVNEDYQRLAERNRKLGLLMGSAGLAFGRGGVSPFVLVGQLFRLKKLDPDFVCPRCQGMTADPFVITFCPRCGERHQEGALRSCRCGHDFRKDGAQRLAQRLAAERASVAGAPPPVLPPPPAQLPPVAAKEPSPPDPAPAPPPPLEPPGPVILALELASGTEPPRTISVESPLLVGRDPALDIVISDPRVSRRHCRLSPHADGLLLEDLGSSNGTAVDGARVQGPVLLQGGETIALGSHRLRVVRAAAAATVVGDLPELDGG